jgi:hypothetical protein
LINKFLFYIKYFYYKYNRLNIILRIFLIIFINIEYIYAQRTEIGFLLGGSYYIGDLNPKKHFLGTQPALGVIYRYNLNTRFAWKSNFYAGRLQNSDALSKADEKRNLSFRSYIAEVSTQIEFNFFDYMTGDVKKPFSPYIFGGISIFKFNPQAEYDGKWYDLQPLSTEGQGTTEFPDRHPYSTIAFAIPFGMGLKLAIVQKFCFGLEWGIRKTFTDYIDDVSKTYPDPLILKSEVSDIAAILSDRAIKTFNSSNTGLQRGNSKNNDWYSFAGIFFTYKIPRPTSCPAFKKKKPPQFI